MATMEECRASSKGGECSLLIFLSLLVHGPVWVVANLSGSMEEGQVGDVVAWFIDKDIITANVFLLALVVLCVLCEGASRIVVSDAFAPEVCMVPCIVHGSIGLPVISHTFPGTDLRLMHIHIVV